MIINKLKCKKTSIDSCPDKILKILCPILAPVIVDIINSSFSSGVFPRIFKQAYITPVFKSGNPLLITNYRPISVMSTLSKIFESCILSRMKYFFTKNSILAPCQFGFQEGRSTEDALRELTEHIYDKLNKKLISIPVFIDFKRAFDTVDHTILLRKLEAYGVRGLPLKLLTSYLSNRSHCVKLKDEISPPVNQSIGLPQGSLLGPALFLIFINDIPRVSDRMFPILFADDTTLCFSGHDLSELVHCCNGELVKFFSWTVSNRLTVISKKLII